MIINLNKLNGGGGGSTGGGDYKIVDKFPENPKVGQMIYLTKEAPGGKVYVDSFSTDTDFGVECNWESWYYGWAGFGDYFNWGGFEVGRENESETPLEDRTFTARYWNGGGWTNFIEFNGMPAEGATGSFDSGEVGGSWQVTGSWSFNNGILDIQFHRVKGDFTYAKAEDPDSQEKVYVIEMLKPGLYLCVADAQPAQDNFFQVDFSNYTPDTFGHLGNLYRPDGLDERILAHGDPCVQVEGTDFGNDGRMWDDGSWDNVYYDDEGEFHIYATAENHIFRIWSNSPKVVFDTAGAYAEYVTYANAHPAQPAQWQNVLTGIKTLSQDEYDGLSEDEKNNPAILYNIK